MAVSSLAPRVGVAAPLVLVVLGVVVHWLEPDPALQPLICPDESGPAQRLANRLRGGFRELMAARGADLEFGRTLPRLIRDRGLVDVEADGFFPLTAPAGVALESATVRQIRGQLVGAGLATGAEVDEHLADLATGALPDLTTAPLISAWGRKSVDTAAGVG